MGLARCVITVKSIALGAIIIPPVWSVKKGILLILRKDAQYAVPIAQAVIPYLTIAQPAHAVSMSPQRPAYLAQQTAYNATLQIIASTAR